MEDKQQRKARVSEARGGAVLMLICGAGVIATHVADGWTAAWLWATIFLMCVSVAALAAAEVVKELSVDGDE